MILRKLNRVGNVSRLVALTTFHGWVELKGLISVGTLVLFSISC